jgi:hypothetical protein
MTLLGTIIQVCFLSLAVLLGFERTPILWLVPLTVCMALVGWITDRYWKLRFYDIDSQRDWFRFWLETLFGLACFVTVAYFLGRLIERIWTAAQHSLCQRWINIPSIAK